MDDIRLPMQQGSMDDISQVGDTSSQGDSESVSSMNTQGAKAIYEREARITIDYESLDEAMKEVRVHLHFLSHTHHVYLHRT